jgi:hypothetical protein
MTEQQAEASAQEVATGERHTVKETVVSSGTYRLSCHTLLGCLDSRRLGCPVAPCPSLLAQEGNDSHTEEPSGWTPAPKTLQLVAIASSLHGYGVSTRQ